MPEQDNCPHNNIESNMCSLHCTDCGKVLEQDNWKETVDSWMFDFSDNGTASMKTGESTFVPYPNDFIKDFISSLLSSQAHALKERMITEIKKQKQWVFTTPPGLEEVSGKIIPRVIEDSEFILVKKLLSAIESIEI